MIDDLEKVGPRKPLGYLPLQYFIDYKIDIGRVKQYLQSKGLMLLELTEAECGVASGALFAYNYEALSKLLHENRKLLQGEGWPDTPEAFTRHLKVKASQGTELYKVIALAYGRNSSI